MVGTATFPTLGRSQSLIAPPALLFDGGDSRFRSETICLGPASQESSRWLARHPGAHGHRGRTSVGGKPPISHELDAMFSQDFYYIFRMPRKRLVFSAGGSGWNRGFGTAGHAGSFVRFSRYPTTATPTMRRKAHAQPRLLCRASASASHPRRSFSGRMPDK
jgi:hypothetical protein